MKLRAKGKLKLGFLTKLKYYLSQETYSDRKGLKIGWHFRSKERKVAFFSTLLDSSKFFSQYSVNIFIFKELNIAFLN